MNLFCRDYFAKARNDILCHVERSVSVVETSFESLRQAQGDFMIIVIARSVSNKAISALLIYFAKITSLKLVMTEGGARNDRRRRS